MKNTEGGAHGSSPRIAQRILACRLRLRANSVTQLSRKLLVGQSGVNDDLAIQDCVLRSLDGSLRFGGGQLVVVLVGHDADAAFRDAELNDLAPVGTASVPLVEQPDEGVADVLQARGQRDGSEIRRERQLLVGVNADKPCLASLESSFCRAVAGVTCDAPDDVALVIVDHGQAIFLGDGGIHIVVGVAGIDLDVGVDGLRALNEADQEVVGKESDKGI